VQLRTLYIKSALVAHLQISQCLDNCMQPKYWQEICNFYDFGYKFLLFRS